MNCLQYKGFIDRFKRKSIRLTVEISNFVSRVWAQIVKRVVVRFLWNFNTMIWHLYVFILATCKNFPIADDFSRAKKRKNKAVFEILKRRSTCTKFFMLWKWSEKSVWVFFILVGWLTFISAYFWNFPISGCWDIGYLKNIDFLEILQISPQSQKLKIPNYSLEIQLSENLHYRKTYKKKIWKLKLPKLLNPTIKVYKILKKRTKEKAYICPISHRVLNLKSANQK